MQKPLRPCSHPGCPTLVERGVCDVHKKQCQRAWDDRRGTSADRGYDHRWRAARRAFLAEHPLCAECHRQGRVTAATLVDHIIPHRGDQTLFWDRTNWQSLCDEAPWRCHSVKRAAEAQNRGSKPRAV